MIMEESKSGKNLVMAMEDSSDITHLHQHPMNQSSPRDGMMRIMMIMKIMKMIIQDGILVLKVKVKNQTSRYGVKGATAMKKRNQMSRQKATAMKKRNQMSRQKATAMKKLEYRMNLYGTRKKKKTSMTLTHTWHTCKKKKTTGQK
uniref:ORFX protein n=1 Tax=Cacao swollen shoot CD virus TaxID=1960255 RepID=A0A2H4U921_9VIRU|nr:ORFX protein [Cacao swollen shoot CD virus]